MTITTQAAPVESTVAEPRLLRYRDAALATDGSLDSVLTYLRELASASMSELAASTQFTGTDEFACAMGALQGHLGALSGILTREVDADVRAVAFPVLTEVVREARQRCANERCGEWVLPGGEEHCSDECRRAHIATGGE